MAAKKPKAKTKGGKGKGKGRSKKGPTSAPIIKGGRSGGR
jgi:hypothetical protein